MLPPSLLLRLGAAVLLYVADGFWGMFAAQMVLVYRAPPSGPAQLVAGKELPGGDRSVQAGRLNATTSFGQILGNGTCGSSRERRVRRLVNGDGRHGAGGPGHGLGPRVPALKDDRAGAAVAKLPPLLGKPSSTIVMCAYCREPFAPRHPSIPPLQYMGLREEASGVCSRGVR